MEEYVDSEAWAMTIAQGPDGVSAVHKGSPKRLRRRAEQHKCRVASGGPSSSTEKSNSMKVAFNSGGSSVSEGTGLPAIVSTENEREADFLETHMP